MSHKAANAKKKLRDDIDASMKKHQERYKTDEVYRKEIDEQAAESRRWLLKEAEKAKGEDALFEALKPILEKNTGPGNGAYLMARLIELYDCKGGEELSPAGLSISWTAEAYAAIKVEKALPLIDEIYSGLKKHKFNEANEVCFSDMDDHLFFIPHKKDRIFSYRTDSPLNLLFIAETLDGYPNYITKYHCRKYWDAYTAPEDKYEIQEADEYKQKGITHAILKADWLTQEYSDNLHGNQYVQRPDLKWYQKNNFEVRFGDFRDPGYVFTIEAPRPTKIGDVDVGRISHPRVEGALTHIGIINRAIFTLEVCKTALDSAIEEKE